MLSVIAPLFTLGLGGATDVHATTGDCGQPISAGANPTATDALFILNAAVGFGSCELCTCDTDDSGLTTATDALKTLNAAVGVTVTLACPACTPVSLCDALTLGADSGEPFDTIEIGDVPDGKNSVWAIITPAVGEDGVAGVLLDDDGVDRLMVPTHPDGGVGGGTVGVAITDGTEICPLGSLDILPLAPAPADTSANTLAAFLALIDAGAADYGLTGADLATTPLDQLPPLLIPLALAQIVLAGPDNVNSLAALLAGTAPESDGLDMDLLNRAFAKIELESALQELLASRSPLIPAASTVHAAQHIPTPATSSCGALQRAEFQIDNAEQLSTLMQEGLAGRDGQTSLGNQVIKDSLSTIFMVLGLGNQAVGAAGAAALFAWSIDQQAAGSLYPSLLTKIEFEVENGGRIPEDRMDGGDGGLPPFPEWSDPQLYATNLGMELTRASIEFLIAAANLIPTPGLPGAELLAAGSLEAANDALDNLGEGDCWTIPPTTWGPIGQARDPKYVEPLFFGDSVEQVLFEFFEPIALGTTQLRIRTTDAFSGPQISAEKDIEVVTKRVTMQMPTITVQPGMPVEVIATVSDSYRPEALEWEYPAFVMNPMEDPPVGNVHTLHFDAPTDRTKFPFNVRAFSTSLKQDPQTPEREATAQIKTEAGVIITPEGGCLSNGTPTEFTAVVTGLADSEDKSVTWSWSGGGSLVPGNDNKAIYTAPSSGEGEVTITATLNLDTNVKDEIVLPYGTCAINLDLGWYAGASTYDPDLPADVDQMKSAYYSGPLFPEPGDLLMPPAMWWNGRSQGVSADNGSTYLETVRDDMGVDHDLPLSSSGSIDAQLTSSSGSAAALSMSWSTNAECKAIPNSANGIACSSGQDQFSWNPVFWMEVSEAGTYNARFKMSCTRSGTDGFYGVGATTRLYRHVGGTANGSFPNSGTTGPNINGLNPFNAPTPPPLPFPLGSANFVCEPGADEIDVQATWELGAPADPSEADIVTLVIRISSYMVSPVDPYVVFDPLVGSYNQSGTITSSVSVVRVD